ncbi:MAG: MBL fold metallo-hydrolase [Clostridia bacterium]|nr:MBL fold metallo-hydrolase [Clostridia bacterium]
MRVFKVLPQNGASNSYIITADGKEAVVVDPSEERIADILDKNGLVCKAVLLTHGHFDHVGGCGVLFNRGAVICCGENENDLIFSKEYLNIFGGVSVPRFEIGRTFRDNEEFDFCGIKFKALSTAGHTAGSMCYIADGVIFSGDTLFAGSIGRTDLPTGNYREIMNSLKKLSNLDGDYTVLCGHGEDTTLEQERHYNAFLRNI